MWDLYRIFDFFFWAIKDKCESFGISVKHNNAINEMIFNFDEEIIYLFARPSSKRSKIIRDIN